MDSNPLFQCRKIPLIILFTENNSFQIEATGKLRIFGFSLSFRFWRYQFWWSIYSHNLMILWSILLRMIMLWCDVMKSFLFFCATKSVSFVAILIVLSLHLGNKNCRLCFCAAMQILFYGFILFVCCVIASRFMSNSSFLFANCLSIVLN